MPRFRLLFSAIGSFGLCAASGCGEVAGPDCTGNLGSLAVTVISNVSTGANVNGATYMTNGTVERVHSTLPAELSGTYSLCGLGLTDTNRTFQFELVGDLNQGQVYGLTPNNTGDANFVQYEQGGANPDDQRVWVSDGGTLTLQTLAATSATVLIQATGMKPIPQNGNTAAVGTFDMTATAIVNF